MYFGFLTTGQLHRAIEVRICFETFGVVALEAAFELKYVSCVFGNMR
jgi:hypothetical protein